MGNQRHPRPTTCPPWCAVEHGIHGGEEDTVHISHELCVRNVLMWLCSSIDPATGERDGPYVLMGDEEYTMDQVDDFLDALAGLRAMADESDRFAFDRAPGEAVTSPRPRRPQRRPAPR